MDQGTSMHGPHAHGTRPALQPRTSLTSSLIRACRMTCVTNDGFWDVGIRAQLLGTPVLLEIPGPHAMYGVRVHSGEPSPWLAWSVILCSSAGMLESWPVSVDCVNKNGAGRCCGRSARSACVAVVMWPS